VRRIVFAIGVCAFSACGTAEGAVRAPSSPAAGSQRAAHEPDRALELALQLPAGADRCVIARPRRVPRERLPLLARLSQADPLAWRKELELEAYASAQLERRDGPGGQVTLLWMRTGDRARARALLAAHGGLGLHWAEDGQSCSPAECPVRARFAGDHVVRIEHGAFVPAERAGVEAQCARTAERAPAAVEVSVVRSRSLGGFMFTGLPLRASAVLRAYGAGIHVSRVDRMRDPIEAERALGEGLSADLLLPRSGSIGTNLQRTRVADAVHTELDVPWQDLALARDDEARLQAAGRDADALSAAQPEPATAASRREDVLAELGYRLELLQRADGEARAQQAQAARLLLEQALARDPDDEGMALLLSELLVAELRDPGSARAIVQRFAARPGASRSWPAIARHAAALTSEEALAQALVEQALIDRRHARVAAHEIVTEMRAGTSFERAERAALERAR
jgi:hypothetical protein